LRFDPLDAAEEGEATSRARAGAWLLAIAIAGSALAAGTVHPVVLCTVTAVLAVAAALTWWDAEPVRPRAPATQLLLLGCALTLYTLLQCIPLPLSWLGMIAPRNADVWSRVLAPLHEAGPSWAPLTVDPIATHLEVLKGVAYVLAFLAALPLARRRAGIAFLSAVVVTTGLALAMAALLHPAFGARKLYGIWGPNTGDGRTFAHLAPLLNPNNLAGYINVAWCLALAGALAPEPRLPRPILTACATVFAATQVWVASRGGVATMVLGTALVLALWRAKRMRRERTIAPWMLGAGAAAAAGLVMLVLGASDRAAAELLETNTTKFQLLWQALRVIPGYPLWGAGRGTFESAFPAFRESPGYWTFSHPENVIAQWIVEWGIPVGLAGLITLAIALRPSAILVRSSTASGAWAGLVAIAVQNLVDLGSEIPGLMMAPVVCAAIVVGGTAGRESRWRVGRWTSAPRAIAIGAFAAGVAAIALAIPSIGWTLADDQRALHEAVLDKHVPASTITAMARADMVRHPAEPYFPFIAALRVSATRASPLPWVEATLERARVYGPAHLVLARWLSTRSPSQARLEYRTAVEQAPEIRFTAIPEAARLIDGYYAAMEVVPANVPGTLHDLSIALGARLPATCVRLDEELARREPTDSWPITETATAAVEDLEQGDAAPWCTGQARAACVQRARELTDAAARLTPAQCAPHLLRARARIVDGTTHQALRELLAAADNVEQRTQCLAALADLADRARDERTVTAALDKIATGICADEAECVHNFEFAAQAEQRRGNTRRALLFYKKAYSRAPDTEGLLQTIAPLAASIGMHAEAADDYDLLTRKYPGDGRWAQEARHERDQAMREVVPIDHDLPDDDLLLPSTVPTLN
jgi:O-antigen ligase